MRKKHNLAEKGASMKRDKRSELKSLRLSNPRFIQPTFTEMFGPEIKVTRFCLNIFFLCFCLVCAIGMFLEGYTAAFYIGAGIIFLIALNVWPIE
jgi:hypothetical protein